MKISLEWLSEYLPGALDAHAAGEALTHGGLPVEVFEKHGDDTVIDVEVTSNRGDCLSHAGVARELAALLDRPCKMPEAQARELAAATSSVTSVRIDAPQLCPHYTARILRNVQIKPSPAWMIRRLEAVGLRPINNIVDVTNYVMFEMGQPLHAFDFDKLEGKQIIVREAADGEKLTSIDGKPRALRSGMLVIADAVKPVALAGVMGGQHSEVSNSTTNILLESARFDPLSVRKTARALAMHSDSSYRFERQIDPTLPERASLRAAQLILETAGGELLAGAVTAGQPGWTPKKLKLRLGRLNALLGVEFPLAQVMSALARLGLSPQSAGESADAAIVVTVPSHRLDLNIEVDLIEEVARIIGYDKIPQRDTISLRLQPNDPDAVALSHIRSLLISAGYFESVTFSFVSDILSGDFAPATAASLLRADPAVRQADGRLRPSILPGLLQSIRHNESNGTLNARLFEIGSVFWADAAGRPVEHRHVALAGSADYHEARGAIELLLTRLDAQRPIAIIPDNHPGYTPSACGRIEWAGQPIGHIGKIDRTIADKLSLRDLPVAAELELAPLLAGMRHVPQLHALPRFPAVRRDLSLVVNESVRYQQVESLILELKLPDLESVEYITTYRGKPLEKGQKSITTTLVFRSPAATLTSEAVELSVGRAIAGAKSQLAATLRE